MTHLDRIQAALLPARRITAVQLAARLAIRGHVLEARAVVATLPAGSPVVIEVNHTAPVPHNRRQAIPVIGGLP